MTADLLTAAGTGVLLLIAPLLLAHPTHDLLNWLRRRAGLRQERW